MNDIDEFKLADVGIERFNKDHGRLFGYIREFHRLSERCRSRAPFDTEWVQIESIFRRLDQYTATHFKAEETLMVAQNYAHLTEHLGQHAHLIAKLKALKGKIVERDHGYISGTECYLFHWLSNHINVHDLKYKGVLDDRIESLVSDAIFNEIISVSQLKTILSVNPSAITLVDVRTAWEQATGVISTSREYPINYVDSPQECDLYQQQERLRLFADSFNATFHREDFHEDTSHVLVCRSGVRTEVALEGFLRSGLEACELIGGIEEWKRQEEPLVTKDGAVLHSLAEAEVAFPCI